jgi:hypothetical protein
MLSLERTIDTRYEGEKWLFIVRIIRKNKQQFLVTILLFVELWIIGLKLRWAVGLVSNPS